MKKIILCFMFFCLPVLAQTPLERLSCSNRIVVVNFAGNKSVTLVEAPMAKLYFKDKDKTNLAMLSEALRYHPYRALPISEPVQAVTETKSWAEKMRRFIEKQFLGNFGNLPTVFNAILNTETWDHQVPSIFGYYDRDDQKSSDFLTKRSKKITQIVQGLPAGSDLFVVSNRNPQTDEGETLPELVNEIELQNPNSMHQEVWCPKQVLN